MRDQLRDNSTKRGTKTSQEGQLETRKERGWCLIVWSRVSAWHDEDREVARVSSSRITLVQVWPINHATNQDRPIDTFACRFELSEWQPRDGWLDMELNNFVRCDGKF